MPKHTYEYDTQGGTTTLIKDGSPAVCPWPPPFMGQNGLGQPQLQRFPCATNCPLAFLETDLQGTERYYVNCGCKQLSYDVKPVEKEKTTPFGIIK